MKHLVLHSGGMDSTTALVMACHEAATREDVLALSVRYGSVHSQAEMSAAKEICVYLGVDQYVVTLPPDIFSGGGSALLGEQEVPVGEYHDPEKESPSVTVVPFRNATLISVATALAESYGYDKVWVAMHASDAVGFAYPDCTPEFTGPMAAAVYVGTHRKVRLVTPFQWMTKSEIVTKAAMMGAPLDLTWSCYRGGDMHCGNCPTCKERIGAFTQAGWKDAVPYEQVIAWPEFCKEWPRA